MPRLTKRIVEGATPKVKEYYLWDEDIPGLGLRVLPSGRKQYIVQYRASLQSGYCFTLDAGSMRS